MSREDFARVHGAAPPHIQRVKRFARAHGLTVVGYDVAARTVDLRGTVGAFSRAFNVQLGLYKDRRGIYRGRVGEIHVPADLDGVVQGVFGLDNRRVAAPRLRRGSDLGGVWHPHSAGISYTPIQLAELYDFPAGVDGAGQCIAIIELGGGYTMKDLNTYFQALKLPTPNVSAVSVGASNSPTGNSNGPDGEVMLDIEVAGAVAPGARIAVYFGRNTDRGFLRAINRAVHDTVNNPSVISISWGGPEASWTPQSMTAYSQAFQTAAALGITVCCAAGDSGSSDGVSSGLAANVDFPASSPYALACGGTRLEASGNSISKEVVWNEGASGGATGGGVSDFFALPSWQSAAGVPPSVNPSQFVGRGVPDVSGNADPVTGYQVRVDGVNAVFGGTSAVAPLWAGLIALLNQQLGTPVGFLNPLLYGPIAAGSLRDITSGNNDMTGTVGAYKAGPGWDACTGLGSPNGSGLLSALGGTATSSGAPPERLRRGRRRRK